MKLKARKGFTLIELLVVIAIIGILAALIIVSLSGAREKAQDTQRKNNARNIDTALSQYYLDQNPNGYIVATTAVDVTAANLDLTNYLTGTAAYTSSLAKRYITSAAGASYAQAWELASDTEETVTTGNGVYAVVSSDVTAGNGLVVPAVGAATGNAFVTYGPQ